MMFEGTWREPDYLKVVGEMYCRFCDTRRNAEEMATRYQCRGCRKARQAAWHQENREACNARDREWRRANRAKVSARQRAYRERVRERKHESQISFGAG